MIDLKIFNGLLLPGNLRLVEIRIAGGPLVDALGREAVAQTHIRDGLLNLQVGQGMSDRELSVTLYHEVLEAATVAVAHPPPSVSEFNEGDFERAAQAMHDMLGVVSPANLERMLQQFGFGSP